jgi:hypothetical protein
VYLVDFYYKNISRRTVLAKKEEMNLYCEGEIYHRNEILQKYNKLILNFYLFIYIPIL